MNERALLTSDQAAEMLAISTKTLREHVDAGDIAYIRIGRGEKRMRMGFAVEDVLDFIDRRRKRKCPSTSVPKVNTTNSTSSSKVVAFSALPRPQPRKRH